MKLRFCILTLAAALCVDMVYAAVPGVSDTEIRLGIENSQTGAAAGLGQGMRAGAEAVFKEVNAAAYKKNSMASSPL